MRERASHAARAERRLGPAAASPLQAGADASVPVARIGRLQAAADAGRPPVQRLVNIQGTEARPEELAGLNQEQPVTDRLAAWIADGTHRVFRDLVQAILAAERAVGGGEARVAQVWENVEARFQTENTHNDKGNSTYHAYPGGLDRYAPINSGEGRPSEQVDNRNPGKKVCYVGAAGEAFILAQGSDDLLRVESVAGDVARIGVYDDEADEWRSIEAKLAPEIGLAPFDFYYAPATGQLLDVHIGHKVVRIL